LVEHAEADMRLFSSIDELTTDQVDFAVVAVPNHLHCTVASRLLAKGISVFLEKPVCLNSNEADQLASAERAGGAVLLAGSAARYRADVQSLLGIFESVGRIRHVELAWVRARGVPDAGGWFTQRRLAGGGALVDLGWHLLDTVLLLLGSVSFDQAVGTISDDFVNNGSRGAVWRDEKLGNGNFGKEFDVEDTARGFLVTKDGISVSLRTSWASHEASDVTLIKIEGSAGTAMLCCTFGFSPNRQGRSTLTFTRDGETTHVQVPDEPIGTEYDRQLDALPALLADSASKGKAIEEARETIAVIERLYNSAWLTRSRRQPAPAFNGVFSPTRKDSIAFKEHPWISIRSLGPARPRWQSDRRNWR
jgi:oxidoreductase